MLSRDGGADGGLTSIPSFYFEYNIERTEQSIIIRALFENICRIGLAEYYNSFYPSSEYKLMMKRSLEYNSYKRNIDEIIDDVPNLDIFGTGDGGDY